MAEGLSFSQLATMCLALSEADGAGVSAERLQIALRQGAARTREGLAIASAKGYVAKGADGTWTATSRGERLAQELSSALEQTHEETDRFHARPYTEFMPTGRENLS